MPTADTLPRFTPADREAYRSRMTAGIQLDPCPLDPEATPSLDFVRHGDDRVRWYVVLGDGGAAGWDVCGPSAINPASAATLWNRAMARIQPRPCAGGCIAHEHKGYQVCQPGTCHMEQHS